MTTLFGIKSCDTCRKALKALENAGISTDLRDVRTDPLSEAERAGLIAEFGEDLINRRSTTWRNLAENERAADMDSLLSAHPTLMKRPVIKAGGKITLGWTPAVQKAWLQGK